MESLLKLLFFTDTHVKGINPRGRIDDFTSAIFEKIQWVVSDAVKREVDLVIHGGDWFDSYDVGNTVLSNYIRALEPLRRANIPVVSVHGSHDVHGYQARTLGRSSLGVLETAGYVTLLRAGQTYRIKDILVAGVPHQSDSNVSYMVDDRGDAKYVISVIHDTLVERPLPVGFDHILLSEIEVNAELVLSGDYHPGHGVYRREDGVIFCNPGALARMKATSNNRTRTPSIAYIEIYDGAPPSIDIVPVGVAKAGEDIFDDVDPTLDDATSDEVAKLVEYLKQETEQAGRLFDPIEALNTLPIDGDEDVVAEARLIAVGIVQEMEVQDGKQ